LGPAAVDVSIFGGPGRGLDISAGCGGASRASLVVDPEGVGGVGSILSMGSFVTTGSAWAGTRLAAPEGSARTVVDAIGAAVDICHASNPPMPASAIPPATAHVARPAVGVVRDGSVLGSAWLHAAAVAVDTTIGAGRGSGAREMNGGSDAV
jgi:hypothetical protein